MTERRAHFLQLMLTAAIAAVLLYRQHLMVLNEDVIWLLVQAGRLLDSGRFGTDFIEVNTPPALLLYLPAALLQRLLGLSMLAAHLVATTVMAAGLIATTVAVLRPTLALRGASLALWPIAQGIAVAFTLQAYHFGQRDCIVILLLLPFLALQAVRPKGVAPATWLQGLAGGLAALAIAVKPHYAPLLALLFLLRWRRDGFWRSLLAKDLRVLFFVGVGIAVGSLVLFPEWLEMVRAAWRFYRPEGTPLSTLIVTLPQHRWPIFAVLLIAIALWWRLPSGAVLKPFIGYLLAAAPCLLLAYLLQGRGYAYHLIPFELAVELAAFLAILSILAPAPKEKWPVIVVSLLLFSLSLVGIRAVESSAYTTAEMRRNPVITAIAAYDRGQGMAIFDTANTPAIFATVLNDTKVAARTQSLWLLQSAVALAAMPDGRQKLETIEAGIVADFQRYQPDLVVVNPGLMLADGDSALAHLLKRADFAAIWRDYRLVQGKIATGRAGSRSVDVYARTP